MARSKGQPGVLIFWELFDVLEALPGDDAKNMLSAIPYGFIEIYMSSSASFALS